MPLSPHARRLICAFGRFQVEQGERWLALDVAWGTVSGQPWVGRVVWSLERDGPMPEQPARKTRATT